MNNWDHLNALADDACLANADMELRHYCYDQVAERLNAGRSMDCDEYRCLRKLAGRDVA
jgi:hypothetical protein